MLRDTLEHFLKTLAIRITCTENLLKGVFNFTSGKNGHYIFCTLQLTKMKHVSAVVGGEKPTAHRKGKHRAWLFEWWIRTCNRRATRARIVSSIVTRKNSRGAEFEFRVWFILVHVRRRWYEGSRLIKLWSFSAPAKNYNEGRNCGMFTSRKTTPEVLKTL